MNEKQDPPPEGGGSCFQRKYSRNSAERLNLLQLTGDTADLLRKIFRHRGRRLNAGFCRKRLPLFIKMRDGMHVGISGRDIEPFNTGEESGTIFTISYRAGSALLGLLLYSQERIII